MVFISMCLLLLLLLLLLSPPANKSSCSSKKEKEYIILLYGPTTQDNIVVTLTYAERRWQAPGTNTTGMDDEDVEDDVMPVFRCI